LVIETSIGRDRAMETSRASIRTWTAASTGCSVIGTRNSPSSKNSVVSAISVSRRKTRAKTVASIAGGDVGIPAAGVGIFCMKSTMPAGQGENPASCGYSLIAENARKLITISPQAIFSAES